MKRLAGLDLKIFLDLVSKSVDSLIRSHRFDEQNALILEFDLRPKDFRLAIFAKMIPGKWRPPATYRIESFEFLSRDLLRFLELTKLYPKFILNLLEMEPRFAELLNNTKLALTHPVKSMDTLEEGRAVIFAEIEKQGKTLREIARQTAITEMTLHNYKKKSNIRLDNFLRLCKVLNVECQLKTPNGEYEPVLS